MPFVSVIEQTPGETKILINSLEAEPGVYNLVLESFDAASSVKSTLKTDTIELTIKPNPPLFESDPLPVTLVVGEAQSWTLPDII